MHNPKLPSSVIVHQTSASPAWQAAFVAKQEAATDRNTQRSSPTQRQISAGMRLEEVIGGGRQFQSEDRQHPLKSDDIQQHAPAPSMVRAASSHGNLTTANCMYPYGSRSVPAPKPFQWGYDGQVTNSSPFHAGFDDIDTPSRADSQENESSCESGQQKEPTRSTVLSTVSTCAYRSGSSNGSSADMKDSPSHSYTAEQWEAFHELEEAEMRHEIRRLEMALAEERTRGRHLQQTYAEELMAQKDAHSRDIAMLEQMLAKVMEENGNLSTMVRRLCAQVGKTQKDKANADAVESA